MQDHRAVKDSLYGHFARIGKGLSSPKRLEILDLLSQGRRSVEVIAAETDLTVGNASAHVRLLHSAGLLDRQREGQRVYYRLATQAVFELLRDLQRLGETQIADIPRLVRNHYEAPGEPEPIGPDALLPRLDEEEVLVIDVRPAPEFEAGHLPGAIHIPPGEMPVRLLALPRDREIVAYCRGPYCVYAGQAVTILTEAGYRARRLTVGLPDWATLGLPIAVG